MSKKLSVPIFVLGMFFASPLLASADDSHSWVLWQEVLNYNAIQYPNPQSPSTPLPFDEALAVSAFSSRNHCEKKLSNMAMDRPNYSKGWPFYYVCLPARVRPFYFGR